MRARGYRVIPQEEPVVGFKLLRQLGGSGHARIEVIGLDKAFKSRDTGA